MSESIVQFKKSDILCQIEKEAEAVLYYAEKVIKIMIEGDIKTATDFLTEIIRKHKVVKNERDNLIKPVKAKIAEFDEMVKKIIGPLDAAERITKQKMADFYDEQERKRQEAQRKLEERARREEEKRQAEWRAQAEKWAEKGNEKKAQERREMAEQTFTPTPIIPEVPKTMKSDEGAATTFKKDYDIVVKDLAEFIAAVPHMPVDPAQVLSAKLGGIKAFIRATGIQRIPGIVITEKKVVSVRPA
jgi:actin-related protein